MRRTEVLWFKLVTLTHAFEVRKDDGTVDQEAFCGVDIDGCADEPVRAMTDFVTTPACPACLRVVQWQQ